MSRPVPNLPPGRPSRDQWSPAARNVWLVRDLVLMLAGLFVIGLGFAGGGVPAFALGVFGALTGLVALGVHGGAAATRWWGWKVTIGLCAVGLLFAAYPLAAGVEAIPGTGAVATGTARFCVWVPEDRSQSNSASDHYSCTVDVTWPDGTSGSYPVDIPSGGEGTRVTLYQTTFGPTTSTPSWPVALTFLIAGGVVAGQAVLSLLVLAAGAAGAKRTGPVSGNMDL